MDRNILRALDIMDVLKWLNQGSPADITMFDKCISIFKSTQQKAKERNFKLAY